MSKLKDFREGVFIGWSAATFVLMWGIVGCGFLLVVLQPREIGEVTLKGSLMLGAALIGPAMTNIWLREMLLRMRAEERLNAR